VQGWYSPRYNFKLPCRTAVYRAEIQKTSTFAWILVPGKDAVPPAAVELKRLDDHGLELTLKTYKGDAFDVAIDLDDDKPPRVARR
jgi:hypothetical protein